MRNTKKLRALLLIAVLCGLPRLDAQAIEMSEIVKPIEIGVDVMLIRPLGMLSLATGALFFGPALAFSAVDVSANYDEALEIFITLPYENVFKRPLGDF